MINLIIDFTSEYKMVLKKLQIKKYYKIIDSNKDIELNRKILLNTFKQLIK